MNIENWEQRFDAVVKETERNLAKVKGTLQSTPNKYSNLRSSPLLEYKSPNVKASDSWSYGKDKLLQSTPYNGSCHKEIWQQEDEIQVLRKQVGILQQSNIHYEQESKLLKSQLSSLKKKTETVPSITRDVTREFEKFKSEIMSDMRRVKQDLAREGQPSHNHANDKDYISLRKELDDSRMRQAEDFQELKADMESLRNRLVKVELEAKSAMSNSKECIRRCQRLVSETSHFSDSVRLHNKSTSTQLQSLNDNCAHLSILRSSVSDLEGRLSCIERTSSRISSLRNESVTPGSLRDSSGTRGSSYVDIRQGKPVQRRNPRPKSNILSDLDISLDDLSMLSDEDDEITLDKSLDLELSSDEDTPTFKHRDIDKSLTDSISLGGESLSLGGGDLISSLSGAFSPESDRMYSP